MAVPIIGTQMVPVRVRLGLALAVTFLLVPVLPEMPLYDPLSLNTWLVILHQILIGALMGFALQFLFQSFIAGAQLIAMQSGLGFASMTDPSTGVQVVVVAQMYSMMAILLFLAMNGHLVMMEVMARSFFALPVGMGGFDEGVLMRVVLSVSWLFAAALLMALPAITALLIINLAFGVMTKAAPQLNVFAIGFPFTMLMGLIMHWIYLPTFYDHYIRTTHYVLDFLQSMLPPISG
ncbi:flagellar biosynthetic protein FliR [Nitrincola iocasae]|uniref:Flagellar biosynthetic protein FliR n=2 Tax=Nitrincola iocasae TaxID=2614693 RepID=A0A5J6LAG0_9GAMM|nr:flagellar biosynthetic protein FliR [Nitrincola iocasae]